MTHPRIRLVRLAALTAASLLAMSTSPAAEPAAAVAGRSWSLERLDSSSDDDGKAYSVRARQDSGTLSVDAPPDHYALGGCVMTFAYWNPLMLQQSHLINPETGEDVAISIAPVGEEDIQLRGASVHARHYHLHSAKLEIDLWYSLDGDWLSLESTSGKGRRLRYVLN